MAKNAATTTRTQEDGKEKKKFPNGIKVLVQAIWQFWPHVSGSSKKYPLTARQFGVGPATTSSEKIESENVFSHLEPIVSSLASKYPGAKSQIPLETPAKTIYNIGSGLIKLNYMHIRFISEYIGITSATFLMHANLISIERRLKHDKDSRYHEIKALINEMRDYLDRMDQIADEKIDSDSVYTRIYETKNGEEYLADLSLLKSQEP